MLGNYDVIVIFPIYVWFGASGCMIHDSYFFTNNDFFQTNMKTELKKL